jgi:trigger factor
MRSTVESLEGNKVKVTVELDPAEFEREMDAAFRRIAREVRIPGFRPGKAPRRILEARVGNEAARADALQHALPEFYAQAVRQHDVDVIAAPEIDITDGEEDGQVAFDAVVEIRPKVSIGGYDTLRVTIDRPEVTDDEIDERIDQLRGQQAELESVVRPAIDGDHLSIDITGSQDGTELSGLTAQDYLYELGSGSVAPELDQNLAGKKAGDIVAFRAEHPEPDEAPIDFRVLVKDVRRKVLPELDDEWASEASEFDTVAELRDDLTRRLATVKRVRAQLALQEATSEAVAALVADEIPDALVNAEMQNRLQTLSMRLEAQGMDLEGYLAATGKDQETFVSELRETAREGAQLDLALRAVVEAEEIEVADDDLDAEIAAMAERTGQKPAALRRGLERSEQMPAIRSELKKRKALEWLVDHVEIVDPEGAPIDRSLLEVEPEAAGGPATDDHDQRHQDEDEGEPPAGEAASPDKDDE